MCNETPRGESKACVMKYTFRVSFYPVAIGSKLTTIFAGRYIFRKTEAVQVMQAIRIYKPQRINQNLNHQ